MNSNFLPKVSIIIPVYNGSNYLKEAIDSALAQTYKNIEIIVVNDGSNDEGATEKIAKSYGKKIKYYRKENGGVATALNLGIEKMTGEYFSWLSHDDLYYTDKIEKQINFLEKLKNKKVVLYSDYEVINEDSRHVSYVEHNHYLLTIKPEYALLRGCVNGITLLVPKEAFDYTGPFDAELRCTQDYDLWRKMLNKYEFVHMQNVLSMTRVHSSQDSVSPRAAAEGNVLWIDMVKQLSDKDKIRLEGTLYNFYFEMAKFLKYTPYAEAVKYCKKELSALERKIKSKDISYKVSIVIPFFNRPEKTIVALKSALKQSYKNFEIVLVNDGSTEDISKLTRFISGRNDIKYINLKNNLGPAVARNAGIKNSTGDYIAFLDSDDEFLPKKVEEQLFAMSKHNLNVSYTSYTRRKGRRKTIVRNTDLTGVVIPMIISNCNIATPTVIVRREFLKKNRLLFNESMRVGEDTCFWYEVAKHSEILLVDKPLTIVNVDESSHAQDNNKLLVGIKNILRYLLNDDFYSQFDNQISILCNYYFEINKNIRKTMRSRLLCEVPLFLVQEDIVSVRTRTAALVKNSIPYRAARKLYREGPSHTAKAAIGKVRTKISK